MNWNHAISRHRTALLRIVAALFTMIGLVEGGGVVDRLSRPLYRAVLRVLRPAEAAVRRLIIVAARDLVVTPSPGRKAKPGGKKSSGKGTGKGQGKSRVSFQLCDPRKRFNGGYSHHPTPILTQAGAPHSLY